MRQHRARRYNPLIRSSKSHFGDPAIAREPSYRHLVRQIVVQLVPPIASDTAARNTRRRRRSWGDPSDPAALVG